ncbi:MAG: glutathione S-transferase N-terminal domain-containing protein, partial [Alphaproteobacteria bacterium]|nr:glutathione S-transferase N-terminal domain-containing protein [Alphaproteobacteria bacterium]
MIDLYSWKTSNGKKASIMLEECGLEYAIHPINIGQDDQFSAEFSAINPNSKIPAIIDQDGPDGKPYTVIESGAILMYLAEKTGKFMPEKMAARYEVIQWLMFQMGGIGPIFGQVHHFKRAAKEQVPYAINRYYTECRRLYEVVDGRLEGREYLAGDISIAD